MFKKTILAALALTALSAVGAQAATYAIDAAHSSVNFKVRHMMVSKVNGSFTGFDGTIEFDAAAPAGGSVVAEIDVATVDTNDEKRDEHLASADFFDVATFPKMTFRSTGLKADGDAWLLAGDLTLHGVTRPVELALEFNGEITDPWGGVRAGFTAEGAIKRSDFGMTWNKAMDKGGLVVGDEVAVSLEIEAIRQ
jgi:polyisoprenoid-binding protein YceI